MVNYFLFAQPQSLDVRHMLKLLHLSFQIAYHFATSAVGKRILYYCHQVPSARHPYPTPKSRLHSVHSTEDCSCMPTDP